MAIYQGARPRSGLALPWLRPALPDRREERSSRRAATPRAATPARRAGAHRTRTLHARGLPALSQRRVAMALAGIVVAFSIGFVSLTASVRVAATSYDVVRLQAEHDRLAALQQDLSSDIIRLNGEPAIRQEALDAGLGQLGAPVVVQAH